MTPKKRPAHLDLIDNWATKWFLDKSIYVPFALKIFDPPYLFKEFQSHCLQKLNISALHWIKDLLRAPTLNQKEKMFNSR